MPTQEFRNTLFTHLLVAMFGMGSWVAVNSLWVKFGSSLIRNFAVNMKTVGVTESGGGCERRQQAWNLPAYLTVLIAFSNVGPLLVTLAHRFSPGLLNESCLIYSIQALGVIASVALALTWDRIVLIGGEQHSVAFLTLAFALAFVCCTSNVTFLPFMFRLSSKYIKTFFVGQGFSAFFPCVAALVQGVGQLECRNSSAVNGSQSLQPHYLEENFTASTFFWLLMGLMSISLLSFAGLARKSNSKPHTMHDGKESCQLNTESEPTPKTPAPFCTTRNVYLLILLAVSNALTNGVLPSIQTYSCLPYGSTTFHLAVVLGNLANPLACFIAMFVQSRSSVGLGVLAFLGLLCGVYILTLAAFSPCPLLLGSSMGVVLVVSAWMLFTGLFSYVKVVIGSILHEVGHLALVWCGASIQVGSLIGALVMFPLVSVYQLFTSGQACVDTCGQ